MRKLMPVFVVMLSLLAGPWAFAGTDDVRFLQYVDQTVANTTTETTLLGTGVGSLTVPTGTYTTGKTLRITVHGTLGTTMMSPTLQLRVKVGGTTILDTTAVALPSLTARGFQFTALMTAHSDYSPSDVQGDGMFIYNQAMGTGSIMIDGSIQSIATNVDNDVEVTAQWGTASASNTITSSSAIIEMLGP